MCQTCRVQHLWALWVGMSVPSQRLYSLRICLHAFRLRTPPWIGCTSTSLSFCRLLLLLLLLLIIIPPLLVSIIAMPGVGCSYNISGGFNVGRGLGAACPFIVTSSSAHGCYGALGAAATGGA